MTSSQEQEYLGSLEELVRAWQHPSCMVARPLSGSEGQQCTFQGRKERFGTGFLFVNVNL